MTAPYGSLVTLIVIVTAGCFLCILATTVLAAVAAVADMIRVVNLADARRPAEYLWREGLAEWSRGLPRDESGRFTRSTP